MSSGSRAHVRAEVRVAAEVVTIRHIGDSEAIVANVLGRQALADGRERIWLDRLVHRPHNDTMGDAGVCWELGGCYVTELVGPQLTEGGPC